MRKGKIYTFVIKIEQRYPAPFGKGVVFQPTAVQPSLWLYDKMVLKDKIR